MQHKKTAIVKKTYTKSSNNKFLGVIDQTMLNTILGILSVAGVTVIGYKVFFSNGKKEGEPQQQQIQEQRQIPQLGQLPIQDFAHIQQSPEMIRKQIAGKRSGLMVQNNAADEIANNVANISNTGQQPVFAQQPPVIGQQPAPIVRTKEQVMNRQPQKIPPHGDDYYNALSGFKSPFLLTTPKPAEMNPQ